MNRVADNTLAKKLLGWEPQVKFMEGLHKTIDWYFSAKQPEDVRSILEHGLTERAVPVPASPVSAAAA